MSSLLFGRTIGLDMRAARGRRRQSGLTSRRESGREDRFRNGDVTRQIARAHRFAAFMWDDDPPPRANAELVGKGR